MTIGRARTRARALALATTAAVALSAASANAATKEFAPPQRSGPALSVPAPALAESIECSQQSEKGARWVLLIHGTGADSEINWSWNHIPALEALGIPWCTVDLPVGGSGDLQLNAEYVVNAIRLVHRRSGRRIGIIGHSQGGLSPRWAFRFWPDTREMVDDLVGYAPPNHGSRSANLTCESDSPCSPSTHQFRTDSRFNAALNSFAETWAGISYTSVYSHTDFIATPNADDTGTSSLHTGRGSIANVAIQDVCPLQTTEHLGLAYDAVAWALAYDALSHDGAAAKTRIPGSVCAELAMPGINRLTFAADVARAAVAYGASPSAPDVTAEPKLRCYTLAAGCRRLRPVFRHLVVGAGGIRARLRCTDAEGRRCGAVATVRRGGRTLARGRVVIPAGRTEARRLELSRSGRKLLDHERESARGAVLELRGARDVIQRRMRLRISG